MYLKGLQVIGFKSFADKTNIEFHPGVTAVVGPNGCGKSNVLDSIRWVLGEQSAKALRGGQMQDVIFNGSESRKPLGMAEVALTFGDCEAELGTEYNEVTITRRLFRDGSSEYELNKTPCRLKDIHQLFMDTGIGRTAYSIMEQGRIDQILSARPEDRRAVFEEAAGITKFKSQKREALRKLEYTETNLVRLDDIIREIRRQLNSLQRQAGKARRYQELFVQLRQLELQVAKHQYDLLVLEINRSAEQADVSKSTHEQLILAVETEDTSLHRLRTELSELEGRITLIRDELNLANRSLEREEERQRTNRSRVEEFGELRENCRLEISATAEKLRVQEEQLGTLQTQISDHAVNLATAQEGYSSKERETKLAEQQLREKEAAKADKQHEINRAQSQMSNLRNQLTALEMQQKNTLLRVEALRSEQTGLTQRRDEAESQRISHARELQQAETSLQQSKENLAKRRDELTSQTTASRQSEQAQREAQTILQKLQARVDALTQLEVSHADSPPATQQVLQSVAKGEISAELAGTLTDHLQITPGYEGPIALLLGEAVNAILVENEVGVRTILGQLKERMEGQVVLAPRHLPRSHPTISLSHSSALQFVQATEISQTLVISLLSEAHVVESLDEALRIKHQDPSAIVVSKDGTLITRSGLIYSGKSANSSPAVFTRRIERRELELQLEGLQSKANEFTQQATILMEAVQTAQTALQQAQGESQQAEISFATLRHTQQILTTTVRDQDAVIQRAGQELNRLLSQEEQDRNRQVQMTEQITVRSAEMSRMEGELAALTEESITLQATESTLRQELIEQQIQVASLSHQHKSWEQQLQNVQTRLLELKEFSTTRSRESVDYEARIAQAEVEILQAREAQEKAVIRSRELGEKLQEASVARGEHQSKIDEREQFLRGERKKLAEVQAMQTECEIRLTEHRINQGHLAEHIQQTYQVNIAEFSPTVVTEGESGQPVEKVFDWAALEAQVKELKDKVDAMGPVNLESITEFEELSERLKFLEGQQTDLLNAKQQLMQAITEINQTTEKMFAETFEQVKTNFQQIFSELFGGGKATLELSDASNPLECGIDIIARPPGKQPQTISLLSGGERAMTAVSLLLSIYMVKPSPFCVLDEMDAPLDESNINRFLKIVQRFTEHSQFVVITHNKRTISMADAIYGVTMPERGVSKLMSVKLAREEAKEKNGTNGHTRSVEQVTEGELNSEAVLAAN